MSSLLVTSTARYLRRHPWLFLLSATGVALGVAMVVAIDLANSSARRAFELATEAVTGRATHQILGGPSGLPEELFRRLVVEYGLAQVAPVVEGFVSLPPDAGEGRRGRTLRLLGVDPFSEPPFRPHLARISTRAAVGDLLRLPGAALLAASTARELQVTPPASLEVETHGRAVRLQVVGILQAQDAGEPGALSDLVVVDIATSQELLAQPGRLSRIDLRLAEGEELPTGLQRALPPGAEVVSAASRSQATLEMTRGFRLNLQALSLLALVCGLFLIYNAMTFSVVERRTLLGFLRALGVTRRQILQLVLGEAAAIAALGSTAGALLGIVLARGLVHLVARTINDLYFTLAVEGVAVSVPSLARGFALGVGATLLTALAPALEATRARPQEVLRRSAIEERTRRALPRATAGGLALAAASGLLLASSRELPVSFAALFGVLLGLALAAPAATLGLMRLARAPTELLFGVIGRMAVRDVGATLSRTGVAIAALTVAVSVTVGVGTMIHSFRATVKSWIESQLRADLFISPPTRGAFFDEAGLDPEQATAAARVPGVARVNTVRRLVIESAASSPEGGLHRLRLLVFDLAPQDYGSFRLRGGDPDEAWAAFEAGAVIVSEPFAYRRGLGVGDRLTLRTDDGARSFPVAGIYVDYASDQGLVLLHRQTFEELWRDRRLSGLSIHLAPGADPETVVEELRQRLPRGDELLFQANRALKERSLEIFDRTFLITAVLRLLAGLVAFIGVVSAFMALALERSRELGILRATGLTPRQVWSLVTAQTGLMGLAAGLLSLPMGLLLGAVMIFVINRRSFGWMLEMQISGAVLWQAVALALGAALLAGLYPAWKMSRASPAAALREE